jgi:hypothetical protein
MLDLIAFDQQLALLLLAPIVAAAYYLYRSEKEIRILHISRLLIALLAVLLLSQPVLMSSFATSQQSITLLKDDSTSTEVINYQKPEAGNVRIQERTFEPETPSETTEAILNYVEEGNSYLISSDLQVDNQRLQDGLKEKNATLNLVRYPTEDESAVSIEGPEEGYIGAENRFEVEVSSTIDNPPRPAVTVEGESVELEEQAGSFYFNYSFSEEGRKQVKASINAEDRFSENNDYYYVIDIQDKPDVLYVGQRVEGRHNSFLDTDYVQQLPENTEEFDTVVVNSETSEGMDSRVIQGQNVLYTGPASNQEYLPVSRSEEQQESQSTFQRSRIAIVIDISVSNQGEIRNNKAIALNTVEGLPASTQVSLIAYNDEPYLLSDLQTLQNNREDLMNTIKSIETKGPTDHAVGVKAGQKALGGEGNIVMITDGGLKTDAPGVENVKQRTLSAAANSSVTINVVDTKPHLNAQFLKQVASLSNGLYTSGSSDSPLSFVFDSRESESQTQVATVDNSHPVTSEYDSVVFTDPAPVTAKPAAQKLMVSESGTPYLSTWRYGIGKVAAITDQDPALTGLTSQDPQLLLNTLQWLSSGGKEEGVQFTGTRKPSTTEIRSSEKFEGAERLSAETYIKQENYNATGFKQAAGTVLGYNYPVELEQIGYSSDIEEIVDDSGGKVVEPDSQRIASIASNETARTGRSLENPLIIALTVLLLAEIGYRKRNRYL